jgi:hypothetical protein
MTYDPQRPLVTAAELQQHRVKDHGRNYLLSDCGEEDIEQARKQGWKPIYDWGKSGWDLGDYPYVTIQYAEQTDHGKVSFLVQQICEGDHTIYSFDSKVDAYAAIDYLFLWYGAERGQRWAEDWPLSWDLRTALDNGELEVDVKWRGPYRQED